MINLRKRIFLYIIFLASVVAIAIVTYHTYVSYNLYINHIKNHTMDRSDYYSNALIIENDEIINKEILTGEKSRVTVLKENGDVIFDNKLSVEDLDNQLDRPEIKLAIENSFGESKRFSKEVQSETYYYAAVTDDNYIIRTSITSDTILVAFFDSFWISFLVILALFIFCYIFARYVSKRIVTSLTMYEEIRPLINKIKDQSSLIEGNLLTMKTITDNMVEGLLIIDSNNKIISLNKRITKIFKIRRSDYINRSLRDLFEKSQVFKNISDAEKGNSRVEIDNRYYKLVVDKVILDGKYIGKIVIFIDITKEEKVSKIRRDFTSNVSHELKTPLSIILGYTELIENDLVDENRKSEFISKIKVEASSMTSLIDDILTISNLEEINHSIEIKRENISEIISEIIARLNYKIKEKNLTVELKLMTTFHNVNYRLIYEALFNLIDNAIKYNKEGGHIIIITENDLDITISNTGYKISKEHQARIFERFYRIDKSRSKNTRGFGLGLSIVKHAVLAHNGTVSVTSNNNFTTFLVSI